MTIKLIAIDLDGTLLRDDLSLSPEDMQAIQKAGEKGVVVMLCTGRMYSTAAPYAEKLGLNTPMVCFNGAYIKNGQQEVIAHYRFSIDYARKIYAEATERELHCNFYIEDDINMAGMSELAEKYLARLETKAHIIEDVEEFFKQHEDLTKITIQSYIPEDLDDFAAWIGNSWPGELYIVKSNPFFLEVSHPYANKGTGLAQIAEEYGFTREEVMCIGDNHNDLSMFAYSGLAVAMGNAEEEVKAKADYVTATYLENGVAEAIEKFVLGE